jgi:hypothetical protein
MGRIPCQFCPGEMLWESNMGIALKARANRFWLECSNVGCRARGPIRPTLDEAVRVYMEKVEAVSV